MCEPSRQSQTGHGRNSVSVQPHESHSVHFHEHFLNICLEGNRENEFNSDDIEKLNSIHCATKDQKMDNLEVHNETGLRNFVR